MTSQQLKQSQPPSSNRPQGGRRFPIARWRFLWLALGIVILAAAACSDTSSALGRFHQGRTLHVNVVSIDRVQELRYPSEGDRHWSLTPSLKGTELVLVRMKVQNHTAVSAIVNVDRAAAEMRDFANNSYFPLQISDSAYEDLRGEEEAQARIGFLGQCSDPKLMMVEVGTTVRWTNEGAVEAYVEFDAAEAPTGRVTIAPNGSTAHTFDQAGVFNYDCGTADSLPEASQVLVVEKGSKSKTSERPILFLDGPFELPKDFGVDGWMVFEVPEGTQFRDLRWRAGDSITVRF